tara:strand:+ start:338 stop:910 length:573 start_codon:yes stop_codon:yes gene_type:complete
MITVTIETTTTLQVEVETVGMEIIVTTTIEVEVNVAVVITKIVIRNIQINCKILMISITMREKEWNTQVVKNRRIKGSLIIQIETIEEEEEEVEEVGRETMPGTTIKTLKLLEKAWLQTFNMNIQIIEAVVKIAAAEVVEETTTTVETIEATLETTTVLITSKILETTIGKMILTRSHIMNLRKISSKKK